MQEIQTPTATDNGLPTATPRRNYLMPAAIVASVLIIDQVIKFWIKLTFAYHEHRSVFGDWFYLYFIENEGMAFGLSWGGETGKLLLTLFRLVAVGFIFYWLKRTIDTKAHVGLVVCIALILSGALGNIVDSVFYGVIFSESTPTRVATLFPNGGGYSNWLHGRVVDMFYLPIWEGYLPQWLPFWGGDYFVFFQPIFNVADAAISVGIIAILIFQTVFFKEEKKKETLEAPASTTTADTRDETV